MFDAIDGRRTIAQIAPQPAQRDAARVLFEGLCWYDQVVFDVSREPSHAVAPHADRHVAPGRVQPHGQREEGNR